MMSMLGAVGLFGLIGALLLPGAMIVSGIHFILMVTGRIQPRPENAAKWETWKREHPLAAKWAGPVLVLSGVLILVQGIIQIVSSH